MPIYEYKCEECGKVYEKRQKFSDPPDTVCDCEKKGKVSRITSAPALVFKGSGWYVNDYAKSGNSSSHGKSDSASKQEGASANGGSSVSDSGAKSSGDSSSGSSSGSASEGASKPSAAAKTT